MPLVVIGEKRVLFVHIPKTGGTTIEKYLSSHGQLSLKSTSREEHMGCRLQHLHAEPLKQICDPQQINWSFMVIRHPVARILSEYRYRMRKGHWLRDRVSFSTWLSYSFGRYRFDSYYRDNHFRPQYEFEYPGCKVFRFEDGIDQCLIKVASRLELPEPEISIREKVSPEINVKLTNKDISRIRKFYSEDFVRYGYDIDRSSLSQAGISDDAMPSM